MFTTKNYNNFKTKVETILNDVFVPTPNKTDFVNNRYFIGRGLWFGTERQAYAYDKEKLKNHEKDLLSLCKPLPKVHKASEKHAGTISSFDLIVNFDEHTSLSQDELFRQIVLANHFANLLAATKIAKIAETSLENEKAFIIILDPKYREFMEQEGQEPFDD